MAYKNLFFNTIMVFKLRTSFYFAGDISVIIPEITYFSYC